MNEFTAGIISAGMWLIPLAAPAAAAWLFVLRRNRTGRRPVTSGSQRVPGHRLMQQIADVQFNLAGLVLATGASFAFPLSVTATNAWLMDRSPNWTLAIVIGACMFGVCMWKLVAHLRRLVNLRTGLDAEIEAAHQLNKLMKRGYEVLHDVPADGFNIDHLLVGANGVFAVETKGRRKPKRSEKEDYKVVYRDGALQWPNFEDIDSLEQARRQARWASKWLSGATGQPVAVQPALCIPGWYVELKSKPPFAIWGSNGIDGAISKRGRGALSSEDIARISCQVGQRCIAESGPTSMPEPSGRTGYTTK